MKCHDVTARGRVLIARHCRQRAESLSSRVFPPSCTSVTEPYLLEQTVIVDISNEYISDTTVSAHQVDLEVLGSNFGRDIVYID
jgi:hypothetical protein